MKQYLNLLQKIMTQGDFRPDRTGTGTYSLFAEQLKFDLSEGFPLMTTKRVPFKAIATELCWFLNGDTNTKYLEDRGVTIWREWASPSGELGPIYSKQWRDWGGADGPVDQIANALESLRVDPFGRRHIVTAWNPVDLPAMALPPCHCFFQFYVTTIQYEWGPEQFLSCQLYQRSADVFLGLPFNIASYALLTHIVAEATGMSVGKLYVTLGDVHLYTNHADQALVQMSRTPKKLPRLIMSGVTLTKDLKNLEPNDFLLEGYEPDPSIKAPVAI